MVVQVEKVPSRIVMEKAGPQEAVRGFLSFVFVSWDHFTALERNPTVQYLGT